MKLNKLRLLGFKSFVEPTDFLIEPGLTGVVGPNGCGKSNLVEALRWVMGETSHKSLRAAGMDDVIFAGTNNRPARNNAEVTLFLDNADRSAPAQFNEHETLEVSRRIEREKGSLYRINGREVRARDVQLLFADASTGARSPALVHQGRIGEIIQAKPEQRRRVLEEAAGVAGLHARRHEAELRLKAAETNLDAARGRDRPACDADGRAEASGAPGGALPPGVGRRAQGRGDAVPSALARRQCRSRRGERSEGSRRSAGSRSATQAQAEAATAQAVAAAALPPLRDAEARRGAALQRLVMAREALDREEARVNERIARARPPARAARAGHRARAAARGRRAVRARTARHGRSRADAGLKRRRASARPTVAARVGEAGTALAEVEKTFSELTGALADLVARRNQLERAVARAFRRA